MIRVLVVDDKEENLDFLQALLGGHGCDVQVARHGAEALDIARRSRPDIIVSDLLMPVMDGYTLLRHWKADARLKQVPFMVYTAAYTQADDEQFALDLGADAFVIKPAEPEILLARIEQVLAGASAAVPVLPRSPRDDETVLLEQYSAVLVRKLEQKASQLEQANAKLQRDVNERERVAARLEAVQSVAKVGSWETDLNTMKVSWSAQTYSIFELEGGREQTHDGFMQRVHPDDRARVAEAFDGSLEQRAPGVIEHRIVMADGRVKFVEQRWHVVTDAQGAPVRAIGTCQDISERRRLEEQLHWAQRLESVGQLTGGMAHDFNNLLTVILGNAELLREQLSASPALAGSAEMIVSAAQRGAELTQRLLAFARKQALEPRAVDVDQLVAGTTIKMYLPRTIGAAAQTVEPQTLPDAGPAAQTILLVEDDELVRRYAHQQLLDLGYRVLEAHNGMQALEILRGDQDIDLLFTDVVMPAMGGRQLADETRKLRPELKVLYTSGYAENAIVHHGRLDPGVQLLTKPYRRAELARKLRDVFHAPRR